MGKTIFVTYPEKREIRLHEMALPNDHRFGKLKTNLEN